MGVPILVLWGRAARTCASVRRLAAQAANLPETYGASGSSCGPGLIVCQVASNRDPSFASNNGSDSLLVQGSHILSGKQ